MPKRACPFEDDLLPQIKVHVGQKQVNEGVCKEERMKDVYAKTLNLLKEGVKTLSRKLNVTDDILLDDLPLPMQPSPRKTKSERNLKQTMLNSKLELEPIKKNVNGTVPKYDLCGCSRVIDSKIPSKCYYCDQVLCFSCLLQCASCSESYCQNCCLSIYDGEERSMCLNCYQYK
ncbi:hypothetical protein KM043_012892 [Ampulex compressa]|nr:hypothetical protein KM043_012892 [Ampulex compressa]